MERERECKRPHLHIAAKLLLIIYYSLTLTKSVFITNQREETTLSFSSFIPLSPSSAPHPLFSLFVYLSFEFINFPATRQFLSLIITISLLCLIPGPKIEKTNGHDEATKTPLQWPICRAHPRAAAAPRLPCTISRSSGRGRDESKQSVRHKVHRV